MRLRRTLALAAVATAVSCALPFLMRSAPQHLPAVSVAGVAETPHAGQPQDQDPAGTWTWPLAPPPGSRRPVIVHPFEPPAKRWQAGHRGVDLLGGPGQEVLAAGQGTVSYAGTLFGRPVVAIDHTDGTGTGTGTGTTTGATNDTGATATTGSSSTTGATAHTTPGRDTLRTTYEPVDPIVKVGDKVRAGQVIGHLVDSPTNHCAPRTCLHWGLVRGFGHGERYLDPSALLGHAPVRLLPVWMVR
jgi:murein DD-endopeptidase MepM/ murein hydrolase activator NlpD